MCEIPVYEKDGKEVKSVGERLLVVLSHWNRNEFVRLQVDGVDVTVSSRDLKAAIENATNTARF